MASGDLLHGFGMGRAMVALLALAAMAPAQDVVAQEPPAGAVAGTPVPIAPASALAGAPGPAPVFIAGLTPWERPHQAPRITGHRKTSEWYRAAMYGVAEPYPPSLGFVDDVGAWHMFFGNPGMTGPYDIRGWHVAE